MRYLDAQLNIRSSDVILGLPFNIAQWSFVVYLLCSIVGDLEPGQMNVILGDCHIYESHIEKAKELIKRTPKCFPQLVIQNIHEFIEEYVWEDVELSNYEPHPRMKFEMVA